MSGEQVDVICPKCGWGFHAQAGTLKIECMNPSCGEEIRISKPGDLIEAKRVATTGPDKEV